MDETGRKHGANISSTHQDVDEGKIDGVVIGVLVGFAGDGTPLVAFPGNPDEAAVRAKATTVFARSDVGSDVALLFEGGAPSRPLVIGRVQRKATSPAASPVSRAELDLDGERLVLSCDREIVLRCGKASITLTRAGKVIIRGEYILSHSAGVNRIRGGSVQVN